MSDLTDHLNLTIIRGVLSSAPRHRELPSGSALIQLDVTTRLADRTLTVPIVAFDRRVDVDEGDQVVVIGAVQRRFFRAGGITQSRTEVVADRVLNASRPSAVRRAIGRACAVLDP